MIRHLSMLLHSKKLKYYVYKLRLYYHLLTKIKGRTWSYRPSFFPSIYGPRAKHVGYKLKGKNKDTKLTVWTKKTRLVRFLLYLYCVSDELWGTISIHAEQLQISDAPWKQNDSIWNCSIHNLELVKESLNQF